MESALKGLRLFQVCIGLNISAVCQGDLKFLNSFAVLKLAALPETVKKFPEEEWTLFVFCIFF